MKKLLLLLVAMASVEVFAAYASQVNLSPITATIEQNVASSLTLSQTGGSSLVATYIRGVMPQVWRTNTGSSVTSFAFGGPSLGKSLAGQTNIFGGSLTLPMSWKFHAPSIYPSYGSSVQVGTQTYKVGLQVTLSDGSILYPTPATITVNPMTLPTSQVTGWH